MALLYYLLYKNPAKKWRLLSYSTADAVFIHHRYMIREDNNLKIASSSDRLPLYPFIVKLFDSHVKKRPIVRKNHLITILCIIKTEIKKKGNAEQIPLEKS